MLLKYNDPAPTDAMKVRTTDGDLYVFFIEDTKGVCRKVMLQIGKSGTAVRAWTDAVMELTNVALDNNVDLATIAVTLSNIYTDRYVHTGGMNMIKSGPDGFVYAINKYIRTKFKQATVPFDMPWES